MKYTFDKGIAFILEGPTEKVFYLSLLNHLCKNMMEHLSKNVSMRIVERSFMCYMARNANF